MTDAEKAGTGETMKTELSIIEREQDKFLCERCRHKGSTCPYPIKEGRQVLDCDAYHLSKTDVKKYHKREAKEKAAYTLEKIDDLPNWEADGHIQNIASTERNVNGERKVFCKRVFYNETKLIEEEIPLRFIPNTGPSWTLEPKYTALNEVYEILENEIESHVYLEDPINYSIMALAAMSSYFREAFNHYPYLDFYSAEHGCGKTTAMQITVFNSFNGFVLLNPTVAVLFRAVDSAKSSIGIDQIDDLFTKKTENRDVLNLLDSGHTKGIEAYRMDMEQKPPMPIGYDPFGFKAFTRLRHIPIELQDRCITIIMVRNKGRKKLKQYPISEKFKDIRDSMYWLRLKLSDQVRERYEEISNSLYGLTDRNLDKFAPLLTIASLIKQEMFDEILEYARKYEEKLRFSHDEMIILLLETILEAELFHEQKVTDLRDFFNSKLKTLGEIREEDKGYSSKRIISYLEALGFSRTKKRAQNHVHFRIDIEKLADRCFTYDIDEELMKEHIPSTNLTNLTNLTKYMSENTSGENSTPEKVSLVRKVRFPEDSINTFEEFKKELVRIAKSEKGIWRNQLILEATERGLSEDLAHTIINRFTEFYYSRESEHYSPDFLRIDPKIEAFSIDKVDKQCL